MGDPSGWVAALGQLARRRAWRKLVEIAGTMLVAHRGGGAPGLTAEQVREGNKRKLPRVWVCGGEQQLEAIEPY